MLAFPSMMRPALTSFISISKPHGPRETYNAISSTLSTKAAFFFALRAAKTCDPTVVGMPNDASVMMPSYREISLGWYATGPLEYIYFHYDWNAMELASRYTCPPLQVKASCSCKYVVPRSK